MLGSPIKQTPVSGQWRTLLSSDLGMITYGLFEQHLPATAAASTAPHLQHGGRIRMNRTAACHLIAGPVGDWLVIKGTTVERSDQRGVFTEVRSADGSPPYTVRWLTSGHVATVFPARTRLSSRPRNRKRRTSGRGSHTLSTWDGRARTRDQRIIKPHVLTGPAGACLRL